jgi:hypothetical protein
MSTSNEKTYMNIPLLVSLVKGSVKNTSFDFYTLSKEELEKLIELVVKEAKE